MFFITPYRSVLFAGWEVEEPKEVQQKNGSQNRPVKFIRLM